MRSPVWASTGLLETGQGTFPLLSISNEDQMSQDANSAQAVCWMPWDPRNPQAQRAIHKLLTDEDPAGGGRYSPNSPASPSQLAAKLHQDSQACLHTYPAASPDAYKRHGVSISSQHKHRANKPAPVTVPGQHPMDGLGSPASEELGPWDSKPGSSHQGYSYPQLLTAINKVAKTALPARAAGKAKAKAKLTSMLTGSREPSRGSTGKRDKLSTPVWQPNGGATDWDLLLEPNRLQMMQQLEAVTNLMRLATPPSAMLPPASYGQPGKLQPPYSNAAVFTAYSTSQGGASQPPHGLPRLMVNFDEDILPGLQSILQQGQPTPSPLEAHGLLPALGSARSRSQSLAISNMEPNFAATPTPGCLSGQATPIASPMAPSRWASRPDSEVEPRSPHNRRQAGGFVPSSTKSMAAPRRAADMVDALILGQQNWKGAHRRTMDFADMDDKGSGPQLPALQVVRLPSMNQILNKELQAGSSAASLHPEASRASHGIPSASSSRYYPHSEHSMAASGGGGGGGGGGGDEYGYEDGYDVAQQSAGEVAALQAGGDSLGYQHTASMMPEPSFAAGQVGDAAHMPSSFGQHTDSDAHELPGGEDLHIEASFLPSSHHQQSAAEDGHEDGATLQQRISLALESGVHAEDTSGGQDGHGILQRQSVHTRDESAMASAGADEVGVHGDELDLDPRSQSQSRQGGSRHHSAHYSNRDVLASAGSMSEARPGSASWPPVPLDDSNLPDSYHDGYQHPGGEAQAYDPGLDGQGDAADAGGQVQDAAHQEYAEEQQEGADWAEGDGFKLEVDRPSVQEPVQTSGIGYTVVRSVVAPVRSRADAEALARQEELLALQEGLGSTHSQQATRDGNRAAKALSKVATGTAATVVGGNTPVSTPGVNMLKTASVMRHTPKSTPATSAAPTARDHQRDTSPSTPSRLLAKEAPLPVVKAVPAEYKHKKGATEIGVVHMQDIWA